MLHAWCFAEHVGGRVIVFWPPPAASLVESEIDAEYNPKLIFDLLSFYQKGFGDELLFLEGRSIEKLDGGLRLDDPAFQSMRPHGFLKSQFLQEHPIVHVSGAHEYLFSDEPADPEYMRRRLQERFACLPLNPVVERFLSDVRRWIKTDRYTAIHVRRGDVIQRLKSDLAVGFDGDGSPSEQLATTLSHVVCRTAPFEFYYPAIEEALQRDERIVYFSDSPETIVHFQEKFGSEYFVDTRRFMNNRPAIQKAFLDFNLLVRSQHVIGTGSVFSEFAATLGANHHTDVHATGTPASLERYVYASCPGFEPSELIRRKLHEEVERAHELHSVHCKYAAYFESYEDRARTLDAATPFIEAGASVLDIGCGWRMVLKGRLPPAARYVAADLKAWHTDVQPVNFDAGMFPVGTFDCVASFGLLEHLKHPGRMLRNARRTAGRLLLSYRHSLPGRGAHREVRGWANSLSEAALAKLLENQGWRVETRMHVEDDFNVRTMLYVCDALPRGS